MKCVTFNIRCENGGDGINNFEYRTPLIKKKIEEENPDILCFQEVRPAQSRWLRENFPGYGFFGCNRDKTLLDGEVMLVMLRSTRFQTIAMNTYWLSETPDVPGSRFEDQSSCPRCATEVLLQDFETGRIYLVVNTHLDHISSSARVLGANAVLKSIREDLKRYASFGEVHVLLFGDFNAFPGDPEINVFAESDLLRDITTEIPETFHDFHRNDRHEKIDYIMVSEGVKAGKAYIWKEEKDGVCLSDHYPVAVELE